MRYIKELGWEERDYMLAIEKEERRKKKYKKKGKLEQYKKKEIEQPPYQPSVKSFIRCDINIHEIHAIGQGEPEALTKLYDILDKTKVIHAIYKSQYELYEMVTNSLIRKGRDDTGYDEPLYIRAIAMCTVSDVGYEKTGDHLLEPCQNNCRHERCFIEHITFDETHFMDHL